MKHFTNLTVPALKNRAPNIYLLMVLIIFPQVSETIYAPASPLIAKGLKTTATMVQLTLSVFFIGFALGVFIWGRQADYIGRRKAMLKGLIVYVLGSLGCYVSSDIQIFIISRFIQAFGAAAGSVVTQTIIRDSFKGEKSSMVFAKIMGAMAFSPAIGPLLGGFISDAYGYKIIFLLLTILGLLIWLYAYFKLPETRSKTLIYTLSLKKVILRMTKDKRLLTLGILSAIMKGLLFSYYSESPFVFIEHFHLNGKEYGSIGLVIAGATLLGSMVVKRLIRLHTPIEIMHYGFILQLLSCLLLLLLMWFSPSNLNYWLGLTVFFLFTLMVGFGVSCPTCIGQALINYRDCLGTAGALFGMYYYFIAAALVGFMSFLHDGHMITMPLYFTALMSTAIIFSWSIYRRERKLY